MCAHQGRDAEDCVLSMSDAGTLVCVQHAAPIPRQRDDELDTIVPAIQAEVSEFEREAAERYAEMVGLNKPVSKRREEMRRLSEGAPVVIVRRARP